MLTRIIYISQAVKTMQENELDDLLIEARAHNSDSGITGMLLYKDLSFIQMLEGNAITVNDIYSDIKRDIRHFRVRTLLQESINQRVFPNWSMGFQSLEDSHVTSLPGIDKCMKKINEIGFSNSDVTQAKALFSYFNHSS